MIGIGTGLRQSRGGAGFNPRRSLFALSEPGFWYDPSDLNTLFKDTAGTQPVTTPGDTVALMLDKRQGLVLGPELVTNGDFSDGTTGWTGQLGGTLTVSSGALRVTNSAAFSGRATSPITTVVGVRYKVSVDFINSSNGTISAGASNSADGTSAFALSASNILGRVDFSFLATATTTYIALYVNSTVSGYWAAFDNISVRELPGFHATQSTTANRPTYGIVPKTGRRNLLTRTEEFDNAVWVKTVLTVTPNVGNSPTGAATADRLTEGSSGTFLEFADVTVPNATTVTYSVYAKKEAGADWFRIAQNDGQGSTNFRAAWFNLATGVKGSTFVGGTYSIVSSNITDVGNGWYRVSITGPVSATKANVVAANLVSADGSATRVNSATCLIWGAQLEVGSTATAYQRVTTQFDVTEAGVASDHYLFFGGSTDPRWMVTPTITPGTDKVQVFVGIRKLSDALVGMLIESSSNLNIVPGAFYLTAPQANGVDNFAFSSKGSDPTSWYGATVTATGFASPVSSVLTGLGDISGDTSTIRANGTQVAQATNNQGTGNYLAYPLYIGARAGSSVYLNGQLFQLITRFGPNLPTPTIQQTERFVAEKTAGVTLF